MKQYKIPYKQFEKFMFSSPLAMNKANESFEYKKINFNSFLKKGTYNSELEKEIFKKARNILLNRQSQAETITINTDTEFQKNVDKEIFEMGQIIALDSTSKKPSHVFIESTMEIEALKTVFKEIEPIAYEEKIRNMSQDMQVNWDIREISSESKWEDMDFCISKLKMADEKKDIDNILNTMNKEFLLDPKFYEEIFKSHGLILNSIDFSYSIKNGDEDFYPFQNDTIIQYVIENFTDDPKQNMVSFRSLLETYNENLEESITENPDNTALIWSLKLRNLIKEKVFNTPDKVLSFINSYLDTQSNTYSSYNNKDNDDFFSVLGNIEMMINPQVISDESFLIELNKKVDLNNLGGYVYTFNLFKDLDKDKFQNKEGFKKIITKIPDLIFSRTSGYLEKYFKDVIKELKEEELCDIVKSMNKDALTRNFPLFCGLLKNNNNLFMSKSVFIEIIKNTKPNTNIFLGSYIDSEKMIKNFEKYTQDKEVMSVLIDNKHIMGMSLLDFQQVLQVDDLMVVAKLLLNNHEIWSKNQSSIPDSWINNPHIVQAISRTSEYKLRNVQFDKDFMTALTKNRKNLEIISENESILFSKIIPKLNIETDIDLYRNYIVHHNRSKSIEIKEKIPHCLWSNHDFCISALISDSNYIQDIDKDTLKDNEFLKKLFKAIDDKTISHQVLSDIDHKILVFMDTAKVEVGNYLSFFNKTINNTVLKNILVENEYIKPNRKKI